MGRVGGSGGAGRGKGGSDIYFCVLFDWGAPETDVSTQLSHFPNISLFPRVLNLKSFSNSWGNSYSKFVILDFVVALKILLIKGVNLITK